MIRVLCVGAFLNAALTVLLSANAQEPPASAAPLLKQACFECHNPETTEGGLDLTALTFDLSDRVIRERWTRIHDRIRNGEMPPQADQLPRDARDALVQSLQKAIHSADLADIQAHGRGPLRRLNREEYEQNLRDVLQLPQLDIRDLLPEDREGYRYNRTSESLDMSRVQLAAYLDAADTALRQAFVVTPTPPIVTRFRAVATNLFPERSTFGEREAMFFAKDNKFVDGKILDDLHDNPNVELALFRSAHWPYYGYPRGFIAALPGEYRVRFSARAVLQQSNYELTPAVQPVPMTFRARKPSGPDVSGDVRATGGLIDIQPAQATYETTIRLYERETFEYSLLGLPVPLARNVDGGPPTYRYPPFPEGGQPGIAFQWLEVEGPLSADTWPPPSHRVLFDELSPEVLASRMAPISAGNADLTPNSAADAFRLITEADVVEARRLLRRFVNRAAREPVPEDALQTFEQLIRKRLEANDTLSDALLAGYQAFLASSHFLYLREPVHADDQYAIASRLSHFLTNTRPDDTLLELARTSQLSDSGILKHETDRLIAGADFERFIKNFTDYWLSLRHVRRDDPDVRLYPEYRFDDYLVESMEMETRAFVTSMFRDNLPAGVLVDADFAFVNDRLAQHYALPEAAGIHGSAVRRVTLPVDSPYGGLLTQAAILKVTANGTSTSPVIRGAWIMERIIGQPPPPPPASVPAVEPDIRGATTIRELLALHTRSESCAACHARFDPVGLALENFDILGNWRTQYRGIEQGQRISGIDRAGHDFTYTLTEPVDAAGQLPDGRPFRSIHDLKTILASNPRQLARNLLHQLTLYATGTPVRFADRAELESILDACTPTDYRVRDLLQALVQSPIFRGQDLSHD
jgi:hypothetical protein